PVAIAPPSSGYAPRQWRRNGQAQGKRGILLERDRLQPGSFGRGFAKFLQHDPKTRPGEEGQRREERRPVVAEELPLKGDSGVRPEQPGQGETGGRDECPVRDLRPALAALKPGDGGDAERSAGEGQRQRQAEQVAAGEGGDSPPPRIPG